MATLGIGSVERNGHHYFRGLSAFPHDVQERLIECHKDLYGWRDGRFATLQIRSGALSLESVVEAPFGLSPELDPAVFAPHLSETALAGEHRSR